MTHTAHETMQRMFWALGLSLGIFFLWLVFMDPAFAQTSGSTGSFSCSGGAASGKLYNSNASCPTTLQMDNVFSFLICNMEQLSSNLMGSMYCGIVSNLVPMVMAMLTFAVFVFGVGFTVGVIPATAREFQKFLLKITFVYVFATQAEYLIGYGYRFLVEGSREGVQIVLSGLYTDPKGGTLPGGASVYAQLDNFLARTIQIATDSMDAKWDGSSDDNACKNAIFGALAIMGVAFPPVFYLALGIIVKIAVTFLRAVFGYCYAIVGIAFLLTLAPFFLSFYLFMQTRPFFDKWLGYLVSFALQIVFLFAFLTFIVSIDVKNMAGDLTKIIIPVQETREGTSIRMPWKYCTLCEFEVVEYEDDGVTVKGVVPENKYESVIGKSGLRCKDTPPKPIKALSGVAPEGGQAPDTTVQNTLLKFTGTALLSLLILAYIVDAILKFVPSFAQTLAGGLGGSYATQLGGGYSPRSLPTVDAPGFAEGGVFDAFGRGFKGGFYNQNVSGNSISRTAEGIKQGMSAMVGGQTTRSGEQKGGLVDRFTSYIMNPLGDTRE